MTINQSRIFPFLFFPFPFPGEVPFPVPLKGEREKRERNLPGITQNGKNGKNGKPCTMPGYFTLADPENTARETIDMTRSPLQAPTPDETARAAELFEQWRPWLECEARSVAIKEARGFTAKTVGDLLAEPDSPAFVARRVETAYRRGYWHGFSEALDNLIQAGAKRGAAWVRVARFFDGPLKRWRHTCNPEMSQMPPSFDPRAMDSEAAA